MPIITDEVAAFRAAISDTRDNIMLIAGAGCGKTTAIEVCDPFFPHSTCLLAFNKSIQEELSRRLAHRTVKTFHAVALQNLSTRLGRLPVEANKYKALAKREFDCDYDTQVMLSNIISLYQLSDEGAQRKLSDITPEYFYQVVEDKIESLDLIPDLSYVQAAAMAHKVFIKEIKKPTGFTYDDMLWMLVHYAHNLRWNLRNFDTIVVDEVQDVSPIRKAIIKMLGKRYIGVGDPSQSIYGFAGALPSAIPDLVSELSMKELTLSTTWRCAKVVVDRANAIIGNGFLKPNPSAVDGSVSCINQSTFDFRLPKLNSKDMILCRTNAPLIQLALTCLKDNLHFELFSDFPNKLAMLADRIARRDDITGIETFLTALNVHYLERKASLKSPQAIQRMEDEQNALEAVARQSSTPSDVGRLLRAMSTSKGGMKILTGHKAKGLEADNVYIIAPQLIPAPWVDESNSDDMQQEVNMEYVMVTRAKYNVYYVGLMPMWETEVEAIFKEKVEEEVSSWPNDYLQP